MRTSPHVLVALAFLVLAGVSAGCAVSQSGTTTNRGGQGIAPTSTSSAPTSSSGAPLAGGNSSPVLSGFVEYANGEVRALGTLEKMHGAGSVRWVIVDTLPFMSRSGTIIAVLDVTDSPVSEAELESGTYVMAVGKLGMPASNGVAVAPVLKLEALRPVEMPVESP
jgi:hypothetical protein